MKDARDHDLGMDRAITRRDFLNGVAIGIGGLALGSTLTGCGRFGGSDSSSNAAQDRAGYNPPAGTGMRGDNAGSFEAAHGLRDGTFWQNAGTATPTDGTYDLIVVGAGISGLAAAHFFRKQAGANARILILEAHDDFGGHAARKQLHAGNRLLLSYGAQSIESPSLYSAEAKGLLADVGCDVQKFYHYYDRNLFSSLKLGSGMFFDRETFGEDRLVAGFGKIPHREFFAKAPLSDAARRDIVRLYTEKVDYLPGLTPEQKKAVLDKISYADFLTKIAKCTPEVVPVFQTRSHDLYGVGIDAVSAFALHDEGDDYGYGYPGLDAMLGPSGDRGRPQARSLHLSFSGWQCFRCPLAGAVLHPRGHSGTHHGRRSAGPGRLQPAGSRSLSRAHSFEQYRSSECGTTATQRRRATWRSPTPAIGKCFKYAAAAACWPATTVWFPTFAPNFPPSRRKRWPMA